MENKKETKPIRYTDSADFYNDVEWDSEPSCTCFRNPPCGYCINKSIEDNELEEEE